MVDFWDFQNLRFSYSIFDESHIIIISIFHSYFHIPWFPHTVFFLFAPLHILVFPLSNDIKYGRWGSTIEKRFCWDDDLGWSHRTPNGPSWSQTLRRIQIDDPRWSQLIADEPRRSQMILGDPKMSPDDPIGSQMIPHEAIPDDPN